MLGRTHFVAGTVAGIAALAFTQNNVANSVALVMSAMAGSLLPDLDTENSTVSNLLPGVSFFVRLLPFVKHRGFTHSILGLTSLILPLYFILGRINLETTLALCIGLSVGIFSHILLDMISDGTELLFPIKIRIRVAHIKTGGTIERYIVNPTLVILGAGLIKYITTGGNLWYLN